MITGPQVRQACSLLGWTRYDVNRRTALPLWRVDRLLAGATDHDGANGETEVLQEAFDRAGIEFTTGDGGMSSARRREQPKVGRLT